MGGLLVTLAAVGAWVAATGGTDGPADRYVVAAEAIGPGEVITADKLGFAEMDLPDGVRGSAFDQPDELLGAVALGPLGAGELVQAGSIGTTTGSPTARELSFSVESDWAVAGSLRPGDRIDVLATYGDGGSSETVKVLTGAVVRQVGNAGDGGLGEGRDQTLTISIDEPDAVPATVNAARAGTITVLRVTGATRSDPDESYRPADDARDDAGAGRGADGQGGDG